MLEHWTPYRPELAKEYEEKGYWKKENFSQVFDNIAERFWEREALVGGDQRYTYGELKKGTDRLALHFVKMGLKHQDRVVVQLINIPEFVFIYIALQKIGVIPVMCLPQHRYTEISQIAAKAEAVGYNYVELVEQVAADLPSMKLKMIAGVNQEVPEGYYYINELLNTPIEGEDDAELLRSYLPDLHQRASQHAHRRRGRRGASQKLPARPARRLHHPSLRRYDRNSEAHCARIQRLPLRCGGVEP